MRVTFDATCACRVGDGRFVLGPLYCISALYWNQPEHVIFDTSSCVPLPHPPYSASLRPTESGSCTLEIMPPANPMTIVEETAHPMYVIRRWYKTKPGEARRVATLVHKQVTHYKNAGQRGEFRVSYNGYTLPGDQDVVCLEWTDDTLQSPTREGHVLPKEALAVGAEIRKLIESQRIEFLELLTPEKFQE